MPAHSQCVPCAPKSLEGARGRFWFFGEHEITRFQIRVCIFARALAVPLDVLLNKVLPLCRCDRAGYIVVAMNEQRARS